LPRETKIYRVIDANINRLTEGIRVCEDIIRFLINDYSIWIKFKKVRHEISAIVKKITARHKLIEHRDIVRDVGKKSIKSESRRDNYQQIFFANIQRTKESLRVLEEFSKLLGNSQTQKIKKIRYKIYALEKEAAFKF